MVRFHNIGFNYQSFYFPLSNAYCFIIYLLIQITEWFENFLHCERYAIWRFIWSFIVFVTPKGIGIKFEKYFLEHPPSIHTNEHIVAYRPVAKWWVCKQRPLLSNGRSIHAHNSRKAVLSVWSVPGLHEQLSEVKWSEVFDWWVSELENCWGSVLVRRRC
jgi:hypothetical protein